MNFDDLIGKPYAPGGRGPGGFDCYGLCLEVCARMGIILPEMTAIIYSEFKEVVNPSAGDLVLICNVDDRHAGVVIDKKSFLQVLSTGHRGVHCIRIDHPWVKGRIEGFYRYATS